MVSRWRLDSEPSVTLSEMTVVGPGPQLSICCTCGPTCTTTKSTQLVQRYPHIACLVLTSFVLQIMFWFERLATNDLKADEIEAFFSEQRKKDADDEDDMEMDLNDLAG